MGACRTHPSSICTKKCCPERMEQQHVGCSTGVPIPDCPSAWGHCAHLMPSTEAEGCRDRAVLSGTDLQLLLEEPLPLEWTAVEWKVVLGAEPRQRILTVRKDEVEPANSSLSRRATFLWEPLSLHISAVTKADSGNYSAEIEHSHGSVLNKCFHVSVWGECLDLLPSSIPIPSNLSVPAEPVGSPHLERHVLQQEQEWCSFQLSCAVPGATAVSYSWSRDSEPLGNQSVLEVPKDVQPGLYVCNVSNPASWSTASIDMAAACTQTGLFGAFPFCAVTVLLLLAVCIASCIAYWFSIWWKDGSDCSSPLGAGICLRRAGDGSAPGCWWWWWHFGQTSDILATTTVFYPHPLHIGQTHSNCSPQAPNSPLPATREADVAPFAGEEMEAPNSEAAGNGGYLAELFIPVPLPGYEILFPSAKQSRNHWQGVRMSTRAASPQEP
uniref:Ig-like domain-containing protein n=1 Tax=Meleagris gallopavo TaxID=9103 RepID=A0A803YHQ8_MELGA